MASNQDFENLAEAMTAAPPAARTQILIDKIRHELDQAHFSREWDTVQGLSQMLGGHTERFAAAIGADYGKADGQKPRKDSK